MNYEKILEDTKLKGGYTHSKGGRYVVAIEGYEKIIPLKDLTVQDIKEYHEKVGDEFGTWLENGDVFLDKIECIHDKDLAIKLAKKRDELAIYDLLENKTIRVK